MNIKVGIAQTQNSTQIEKNFSEILRLLNLFKKMNVDLILFPECSLSGFTAKMKDCTRDVLKPYLENIQDWTKQTNIDVALPTAFFENGSVYNSGFWFNGQERHEFYKIGLTESERKFFSIPKETTQKVFSAKGFKFAILICFEAEHEPWSYFQEGDVDAILWPGYWGWTVEEKWSEFRSEGRSNPIFANMKSWKVPLLQSNFSSNSLEGHSGPGPEGLSFIVGHDNKLVYQGPHLEVGGVTVELSKLNGQTCISKCCLLEAAKGEFNRAKCPIL